MKTINISYIDFWSNFNTLNFFLTKVLSYNYKINITELDKADIIIGSCFGSNFYSINQYNAKKILFLGENIRPNNYYRWYNYSISFDYDSYNGKNIRCPLWMTHINWWDAGKYPNLIDLDSIIYNPQSVHQRQQFACILSGNPITNRRQIYNKLSTYKKIDAYGSAFHNPYHGNIYSLLKQYRFNICFENSIYPGYCTEKLFRAKASGCIPIYYGAKESNTDFNDKCFLNLINYKSMNEFIDHIQFIDSNEDEFIKICKEPLFQTKPNIEYLYTFLQNIIDN